MPDAVLSSSRPTERMVPRVQLGRRRATVLRGVRSSRASGPGRPARGLPAGPPPAPRPQQVGHDRERQDHDERHRRPRLVHQRREREKTSTTERRHVGHDQDHHAGARLARGRGGAQRHQREHDAARRRCRSRRWTSGRSPRRARSRAQAVTTSPTDARPADPSAHRRRELAGRRPSARTARSRGTARRSWHRPSRTAP